MIKLTIDSRQIRSQKKTKSKMQIQKFGILQKKIFNGNTPYEVAW